MKSIRKKSIPFCMGWIFVLMENNPIMEEIFLLNKWRKILV